MKKKIFAAMVLLLSILTPLIAIPVTGANATVIVDGGSSVAPAGGSWNSHLPGLTNTLACNNTVSAIGRPNQCRLVTWLPPTYGPLIIPTNMLYSNGSYQYQESWDACDPSWTGGAYVNECQQLSQVTDPQMQGYLAAFYEGYQVAEPEEAIAVNFVQLQGMQIGDGSLAALLIWEMNTGDFQDAAATYQAMRPLMVDMHAFINANSPYSCSGVDGGTTVSASIFAACFVWNEAFAASNFYLNSQLIYPICDTSPYLGYGSAGGCSSAMEFNLFNEGRLFWGGIFTPNAPLSSTFIQLAASDAQFDCKYSPVNWISQNIMRDEGGSAFPSEPGELDGGLATPTDVWGEIAALIPTPTNPSGLPIISPTDSCSS